MATVVGNQAASRDGDLRIHQWLLQFTPTAFSIGLEKPGRLRKKSGLNEHLVRHKYATGPWLFDNEAVLESSDQDLFFILSEKSGELSNAHLQLYRHATVVMDAELLDGDLYISGTFNQARSMIFKIPFDKLRQLH